jgi:hypothetical protein
MDDFTSALDMLDYDQWWDLLFPGTFPAYDIYKNLKMHLCTQDWRF